jgi:hypothetical protein
MSYLGHEAVHEALGDHARLSLASTQGSPARTLPLVVDLYVRFPPKRVHAGRPVTFRHSCSPASGMQPRMPCC